MWIFFSKKIFFFAKKIFFFANKNILLRKNMLHFARLKKFREDRWNFRRNKNRFARQTLVTVTVNCTHLLYCPVQLCRMNLQHCFHHCSVFGWIYPSSLYSIVNCKSYCTHFLYCSVQLSWLDFTALYRPLCCVTLSLLSWYEPKWREFDPSPEILGGQPN